VDPVRHTAKRIPEVSIGAIATFPVEEVILTLPPGQMQIGRSLPAFFDRQFRSHLGAKILNVNVRGCVYSNTSPISFEEIRSVHQ
jgi:hypothetical protein